MSDQWKDTPLFGTADTTTPRRVEQWVEKTPGNFHWKVVFMGSYRDCLRAIRVLRYEHLAPTHDYEKFTKIPPIGTHAPDAADFQLVKQAAC